MILNCRLHGRNFTSKDAYKYFVLRAQQIAISKNWTPVNWYNSKNVCGLSCIMCHIMM